MILIKMWWCIRLYEISHVLQTKYPSKNKQTNKKQGAWIIWNSKLKGYTQYNEIRWMKKLQMSVITYQYETAAHIILRAFA